MKICKECKHFGETSGAPRPGGPSCYAVVSRVNMIYGHKEYFTCEHNRNNKDICGLEAKLFEPSGKRVSTGWILK